VHGSVLRNSFRNSAREQLSIRKRQLADGGRVSTLAGGEFHAPLMASAEYFTVTRAGYPQLLQVSQPYRGGTVTDRMHPHELLSEVAVMYDRRISGDCTGPPISRRWASRRSSRRLRTPSVRHHDPTPLGHHSQDVTHESFGVATLGVFTPRSTSSVGL